MLVEVALHDLQREMLVPVTLTRLQASEAANRLRSWLRQPTVSRAGRTPADQGEEKELTSFEEMREDSEGRHGAQVDRFDVEERQRVGLERSRSVAVRIVLAFEGRRREDDDLDELLSVHGGQRSTSSKRPPRPLCFIDPFTKRQATTLSLPLSSKPGACPLCGLQVVSCVGGLVPDLRCVACLVLLLEDLVSSVGFERLSAPPFVRDVAPPSPSTSCVTPVLLDHDTLVSGHQSNLKTDDSKLSSQPLSFVPSPGAHRRGLQRPHRTISHSLPLEPRRRIILHASRRPLDPLSAERGPSFSRAQDVRATTGWCFDGAFYSRDCNAFLKHRRSSVSPSPI